MSNSQPNHSIDLSQANSITKNAGQMQQFVVGNRPVCTGLNLRQMKTFTQAVLAWLHADESQSMEGQNAEVVDMYRSIIDVLLDHPNAFDMLVRLTTFNKLNWQTAITTEVNGFNAIHEIDPTRWTGIQPDGSTPLFVTGRDGLEAQDLFARQNIAKTPALKIAGIGGWMTDGDDNDPNVSPEDVAKFLISMVQPKQIAHPDTGDLVTVNGMVSMTLAVIGINAARFAAVQASYVKRMQDVLDDYYQNIGWDPATPRLVRVIYMRADQFDGVALGQEFGTLTGDQSQSFLGTPSQLTTSSMQHTGVSGTSDPNAPDF